MLDERTVKLEDKEAASIEYWQARGDAAIFDSALETIVDYYVHELHIPAEQIRLQRSVESTRKL